MHMGRQLTLTHALVCIAPEVLLIVSSCGITCAGLLLVLLRAVYQRGAGLSVDPTAAETHAPAHADSGTSVRLLPLPCAACTCFLNVSSDSATAILDASAAGRLAAMDSMLPGSRTPVSLLAVSAMAEGCRGACAPGCCCWVLCASEAKPVALAMQGPSLALVCLNARGLTVEGNQQQRSAVAALFRVTVSCVCQQLDGSLGLAHTE